MLCFLYLFGTSYISRVFSGKSELGKSQRIGTIGGCLTGRNQLICGSYRIMNLGYNLQHQILCKCRHLWPILDVRSKLNLNRRISHTLAVKYAVCINILIKEILLSSVFACEVLCRGQKALVRCSGCNGTCIHKCNGRNLTVLDFGAFTVREVSCSMTDTECIICRSITSAKARSAECSFYNCTCLKKVCQNTVFSQFHINRCACRINA